MVGALRGREQHAVAVSGVDIHGIGEEAALVADFARPPRPGTSLKSRMRNRELQPLSIRKRYRRCSTSRNGQVWHL
jgi:hypothetical protein